IAAGAAQSPVERCLCDHRGDHRHRAHRPGDCCSVRHPHRRPQLRLAAGPRALCGQPRRARWQQDVPPAWHAVLRFNDAVSRSVRSPERPAARHPGLPPPDLRRLFGNRCAENPARALSESRQASARGASVGTLQEAAQTCRRVAGIVGHDDLKAQIAAGARGRLHRVVGDDANNHHLIDSVRTQPTLQRRMAERIGHLFVQLALTVPRRKRRLKLDARLLRPEHRVRRAGEMPDVDDRPRAVTPGAQQRKHLSLGVRIVAPSQLGDAGCPTGAVGLHSAEMLRPVLLGELLDDEVDEGAGLARQQGVSTVIDGDVAVLDIPLGQHSLKCAAAQIRQRKRHAHQRNAQPLPGSPTRCLGIAESHAHFHAQRALCLAAMTQGPGTNPPGLRRTDQDSHTVSRRQLAGDHALREFEATADGRVEALSDQVHLTVIEMPVRDDGRITAEEFGQQRHHVQAAKQGADADFQGAGGRAFGAGQVGDGVLDGVQAGADLVEEARARLGQRQFARAALKQSYAKLCLQLRDTFAYRGGGQAQAPRRLGKAADLGAAHEALDAAEVIHRTHSQLLVYTDYREYRLPRR
nr:hypothetical protein [Tanacetum cinerariifolium]